MKGYYELLNMDKVKEMEKTAYCNGKIDILKAIEDKMSIGIDICDIIICRQNSIRNGLLNI